MSIVSHATPDKAAPETHIWFSVETPSVYKEHKLPANQTEWSDAQRARFRNLERLAEIHQTHIKHSSYRRG